MADYIFHMTDLVLLDHSSSLSLIFSAGPITQGVMCVHPRSRDRNVMYPSLRHNSSGSTVDTFLTQDHLGNFDSEYISRLPRVDEGDDSDDASDNT